MDPVPALAGREVAVVGAGAWGTTFAQVLADAGAPRVRVWARRPEVARSITQEHTSPYLPDVVLPDAVLGVEDLREALAGAPLVVLAVPVQQVRSVLRAHPGAVPRGAVVVSLLKGLEAGTHLRVSEVLAQELPGRRVAVLSGPNLAREIAARRPCACVVASREEGVARAVAQACATGYFRPFVSTDVVGVELCGALKNLLAVAVGMAEGLGLGDNAKASVVALGLTEIGRLVAATGGSAATVAGLAGAGDAFATCSSTLSRNHRLGTGLAAGRSLEQVLDGLGGTAEAVATSTSVRELAGQLGVAMAVVAQVDAVLHHGMAPRLAAEHLLSRPVAAEG